ncbi:protein of unassigned function [Methylobacterium oryzae CBMB20]|uniref:Protein of unassigned function n=1 Tax=Methylobacterium oryzae CBMB20 TaxID=693986 RepID=A0A089NP38_9HYPH|nr:protein of unassigned function [Methylobacterium oryzae CBMB20]
MRPERSGRGEGPPARPGGGRRAVPEPGGRSQRRARRGSTVPDAQWGSTARRRATVVPALSWSIGAPRS